MKQKIIRAALLMTLLLLTIFISVPIMEKNQTKIFTLPGLPRPIAEEPVIITSAGQSTDTYIVRDISNQLMIRSLFMPQAKAADLKEVKTVVFVIGYSSLGTKLQGKEYEDEKTRLQELIEKAKDKELTVIAVVMGGEQSGSKKTEELIELVGAESDYMIGVRKSNYESILTRLSKEREISLSMVSGVNDISEPYASAFR